MDRLSRFLRDETGALVVEFVILYPVFIVMMLSCVEAGIMMLRSAMLERGVDLAVRDLRVGNMTNADEDIMRTAICNHAAFLSDCTSNVRVELTRVDPDTFAFPSTQATCVERDEAIQPSLEFVNGQDHDLMMLRACAIYSPFFPTTGLGLRLVEAPGEGYALIAASAFVVEPD